MKSFTRVLTIFFLLFGSYFPLVEHNLYQDVISSPRISFGLSAIRLFVDTEPNDTPETAVQYTDGILYGTISSMTDVDWIKFTIGINEPYNMTFKSDTAGHGAFLGIFDSNLRLLYGSESDGAFIEEDKSYGTQSCQLGGTFYLKIFYAESPISYQFQVSHPPSECQLPLILTIVAIVAGSIIIIGYAVSYTKRRFNEMEQKIKTLEKRDDKEGPPAAVPH
jgi:hypothetical protein